MSEHVRVTTVTYKLNFDVYAYLKQPDLNSKYELSGENGLIVSDKGPSYVYCG